MPNVCDASSFINPSEGEVLKQLNAAGIQPVHLSNQLQYLMTALPEELLSTAGFHREMVNWMNDDQRFHLLDKAWQSDKLWPLMGVIERDVCEFIDQHSLCYPLPIRDNSWNEGVDRPRDPWVFEPSIINLGNKVVSRTIVERNGVVVSLDERSENGSAAAPILRLKHMNQPCQEEGSDGGWAIEVEAEECITPFNDFCCPPNAKVTIGYRMDGRIDIMVFAEEMPGNPVLHWIFSDPKEKDLPDAYRKFLWWL